MLKLAESRLCRPNMADADCFGPTRTVNPLTLEQYTRVMTAWSARHASEYLSQRHFERIGMHLVWEVMRCQDVFAALELAHGILAFHTGDPLKASRKPTPAMIKIPCAADYLVPYGEGQVFSQIMRDAANDVELLGRQVFHDPEYTKARDHVWFHIRREHYAHFATVVLFHIIAWLYQAAPTQWPRQDAAHEKPDRYLAYLTQAPSATLSPDWFREFLQQPYRVDEKGRKHIAIPFYSTLLRKWNYGQLNSIQRPFAAYEPLPLVEAKALEPRVRGRGIIKRKAPLQIAGPPCMQKMYARMLRGQPTRSEILWRAVDGRWDELVDQIPDPQRRAEESKIVRRLHDTRDIDKRPYGCGYLRKCGLCPLTHASDIEDVPAFQRLQMLDSVHAATVKTQCQDPNSDAKVIGRHCATLSGTKDVRCVFQPNSVLRVERL